MMQVQVWTLQEYALETHTCVSTRVLLTLHTLSEEDRKVSGTDGGTQRKRHGQMGESDGKESKEQLSHVRERCGEMTLCEMKKK